MCGRFARSTKPDVLIREFGVKKTLIDLDPCYNITPGQDIITVNAQREKQLVACRWGFIPSWAKDPASARKVINARAETVTEKPAFRAAFLKHRCLVIADGFFEWREGDKGKIPYYIHLESGRPFGFAGLYDTWTSPEGGSICTCTIITTDANDLLAPVHDRMPVIIPKDKEDLWLAPDIHDPDTLLRLLRPYPAEELEMYPVSPKVNSPKYNSPDAIKPVIR